jgi:hypothetical protein
MESILVSLISIALVIISSVTLAFSNLRSTSQLADSWKQMAAQTSEISRTGISATPTSSYGGGNVEVRVENDGQTNLADFKGWDVLAQYETNGTAYITYSSIYPPTENQWTVKGIYSSGDIMEIFDPNVLDPGEQMVVSINLNPELASGEVCKITIVTPNGVKTQTQISRQ